MTRGLIAVVSGVGLVAASLLPSQDPVEPSRRYAVVVDAGVADGPWAAVVEFLEKHRSAEVFAYDGDLDNIRAAVGAYRPRYVCFVAPPTTDFPELAANANAFCRGLDDDPYVDAIWGVLTGWDPDHAIELASSEPIVIRSAFTKTLPEWMNWVQEGEFITEFATERTHVGTKRPGQRLELRSDGPDTDAADAEAVATLLAKDSFDLLIGSGHGNHDQWMLMYPRGKGYVVARDGELRVQAPGVDLPLAPERPKVYWAVGNCLTGVIHDPRHSYENSYAMAWLRAGTRQYIGAVKPTWYELNWNMSDWFLRQQGRWTFAESLFLLRQWSRHLIAGEHVEGRELEGTEFTDEIFVLYGDPALEARLAPERDPALDESLQVAATDAADVYRFTYRVRVDFVGEGRKRTAAKYDGWRFFAHLLPFHVTDVHWGESSFAETVCTGETLIWDAGKGLTEGDERAVTFTARRSDR